MEFVTGQKLTAGDLNNLANLADGQQIPSDNGFFKSNGPIFFNHANAKPVTKVQQRLFDVQIRWHDKNDDGTARGENYTPSYVPFWWVYLGSDCTEKVLESIDMEYWDELVQFGSGTKTGNPIKVFSQLIPDDLDKLEDYSWKNAVTLLRMSAPTGGSVPLNLMKFSAYKFYNREAQETMSDGNGWFCTGIPVSDGSDVEEFGFGGNGLYASYIRYRGQFSNIFPIALVFTNYPLMTLGQLMREDDGTTYCGVTLPDLTKIQYNELLGQFSKKIASYTFDRGETRPGGSVGMKVSSNNTLPVDSYQMTTSQWEIVPLINYSALDPDLAKKQVYQYTILSPGYVDDTGEHTQWEANGEQADLFKESTNIYFSELGSNDKLNDDFAGLYYLAIEKDYAVDESESDKQKVLVKLKKIDLGQAKMPSISEYRNNMSFYIGYAETVIKSESYRPANWYKDVQLIAVLLILSNKTDDDDHIKYSIEHIAYANRNPSFDKRRFDTNITTNRTYPLLRSLERNTIDLSSLDGQSALKEYPIDQLYRFSDETYTEDDPPVDKQDESKQMLIRHIWSSKLRPGEISQVSLEYQDISSFINVDTEIENQTSSIQLLSTETGEWYQLYNFNLTSVDLTVASDINGPGRWYAPAPTGLTDTSALFLIKDILSKQLKYAQLSVTPPAVDNCSIQRFWSPDFPGQPQMLSLNRFWEHPLDGTLTGVLSSNKQVVDFNGDNGTFLMLDYLNGRLNLKYMKLQLSVDLSAVSADVKCDTDSTPALKSIEKNGEYIQLHDFPSPTITTKKTTLNNLSATYDLLDSNDSILVRSGTELKYKKLQIETKLPGGSGPTSGYTGTKTLATNLKWNSNGQYKIELWGCDFEYENGLLKSIGNEKMIATLDTVGYSGQ